MGCRGKYEERQRARELRAESWTLQAIADELARCAAEAEHWLGELTDRELTMFCLGLYAGEGSKTPGCSP